MTRKVNKEVKDIWNANAAFWDNYMGEGNAYHKLLLDPNQLEMLQIKKGDAILEIACGNGQFARMMTKLGAKVTAIDLSDEFIKIARSKPLADKIDYQVRDVTDSVDLKKLKGKTYDSAVCAMGLMDMENIEPLIGFLPQILKNNGKFVFSITHPCFNSGESTSIHEQSDIGGKITDYYGVKISNYLISHTYKGLGIAGQPKAQYYFHRPLNEIFKIFFKNNFYLYDLREPSFKDIEPKTMNENVFKNIPPVIICGFKLIK
ncbi:MAG: class I SAM-dependent DNA methyltransferase [Dehalococcoidales bacterium]